MKFKSFIFAATFLFGFVTLQAQDRGQGRKQGMDPAKMAERQTMQMKETLSLSDAQVEKVQALNVDYAKKMQEVRTTTEDRTQIRPKMEELRIAKEAELAKFLTAEQAEKWSAIKAKRQGRRGQMHQSPKGERPPRANGAEPGAKPKPRTSPRKKPSPEEKAARRTERLTKDVNLSEEQAKEVEAIHLEYAKKKDEARANKTETIALIKELATEEATKVDAVLTKEQIEKRNALRAERKEKREEKKMKRSMKMEQN